MSTPPAKAMNTPTMPVVLGQRLSFELPTGDFIIIDTTDNENIKVERLDKTGEFIAGWQFNQPVTTPLI